MSLRLGSEMRMDGARVPRESGRLLLTRRPQVLLMLERLIEYINGHEGCEWMTFDSIANDFRARFPFEGTARPEVI